MTGVRSVSRQAALDAALSCMSGGFVWGRSDCCHAACAAFCQLWSVNPMRAVPSYDSALSAALYVRRNGGARACIGRHMEDAGLVISASLPGVLGLLSVPGDCWTWALGLCLGDGEFAVHGDGELIVMRADAICWGMPEWG
ncbi:hypothetical protein TG4357_02649 [Thalassovita gelatinovora]|uniref:DUF6950 domain-containing protein n=1 Tax=Thalassovita gelatinovora TaxID=53501 RepID=A0A0P1FFG1_THAGE|nr:hypothetical protein [Thalassovita gelatinovora]QIZ79774.1 hypothetical protein HFZ77_04410 [Thalassovita gelatinovora]CUH66805.1 hypothetical protein TG4357_02649 [Thalassovita gelatinovora]SEQ43075.1 hypothetical protein SAMN04488043_105186 [Thalassovita gelatinovora]